MSNTKEDTSRLLEGGELGQVKEENAVRTLSLHISFNEEEHMLIVDEQNSEMLMKNTFKENKGCIEEDSKEETVKNERKRDSEEDRDELSKNDKKCAQEGDLMIEASN